MEFKTPYNGDNNAWSDQFILECKDESLAQQHFKDQCDINILFAKYLETGEIPQVQEGLTYGNFEGIFDFQTAMNAVRTAEGLFQQLPARIKNRFDNNPQKMLEFLHDEGNREEAEFLGLVTKKEISDGQGTGSTPGPTAEKRTEPTGTTTSKGAPPKDENPGPQAA